AMRIFLMLGWVLRNIGRVVHGSEQIKKREDKNPDQIDKVPEETRHFHAVGKVLWITLINFFADRQPHVKKNEHAAEHVSAVQSGDREVTGEIGAVPRTERINSFNVFLLDLGHLVRDRQWNEMRSIV